MIRSREVTVTVYRVGYRLRVSVTDVDTGLGVPGAGVYLFEGGGGVEPPENADYYEETDLYGVAIFYVSGFWRVGVVAEGYESAWEDYAPPEEWREVWTCWGAVGVSRDFDYPFEVRRVD